MASTGSPIVRAAPRPTGWPLVACLWMALAVLSAGTALAEGSDDRVRIDTNLGSFVIRLEAVRAPLTTRNFLSYVKGGFYEGTIFHRVINNFVVQGGGYDAKFDLKKTNLPIANESGNGLSNKRGSVGLARGDAAHSGNSQFYINLTDNDELDPTPLRWGYAVFGRVVEGMDVIEKIARVPTGNTGPWDKDAPLDTVIMTHATVISDSGAIASAPIVATTPIATNAAETPATSK